jgi:ABC-type thiamine transport system substrate-binding protein
MFDQSLKNQYLAAQIAGFGQRNAFQNQVPQNQQPYPSPSAQPQANPAGNINMNFVTEPKQQQ